jgi:hypothetical protein
MQIIFHIPLELSLNKIYAGGHWSNRSYHKNLYRKVPFTAQPVTEYPVHCHYHFIQPNNYDISNLAYQVKLVEDCLVKKSVLKNDSRKYVSGVTITAEQGKENICRITLTKDK